MPTATGAAVQTQAAHGPAPPIAEDPQKDVHVTAGDAMYSTVEEKIEYRDEQGNLLDEEQVKALGNSVSFSTRYETRTRLVDQAGNEVHNDEADESFAGTLAEGEDPSTKATLGEAEANTQPPVANADADLAKERSVDNQGDGAAEPEEAVQSGSATGHDEL